MHPDIEKALAAAKAQIAALEADKAAATTPATSNSSNIIDAAAKSGRVEVTPVFERLDPLKGKGLKFATAARVLAQAGGSYESAKALAARTPYPEQVKALVERAFVSKALGESSLSSGGALLEDPLSSEFIELLRPNVVMEQAPVTQIPMNSLTLTFPRQSGATTAGWLGEAQPMSSSQPNFDNVQLTLKKLGVQTAISNDLLRDNAIAADMIVRQDLVAQASRAVDAAFIRGLGGQFSPRGLLSQISAANTVTSGGAGTPTLTTVLKDLWTAIKNVRSANVPFGPSDAFWILSPRSEAGLAQLRDGVGRPYFAEEMASGKILGYRYFTTTSIPENLSGNGSGTSAESEIYFAVGPQILVGKGLDPQIQVVANGAYFDGAVTQSGLTRDETVVTCLLRTDLAMRHREAGSIIKGVVYGQ